MVAGISVCLLSAALTPRAKSASRPGVMLNLTVNDTGDAADATPGDGVCQTAAGVCTLRAAIEEVLSTSGTHSISINLSGVIDLTGPLPNIDNTNGLTELQISGSGARNLTIRRAGGGSYQIFFISPTFPGAMAVTLSGMTISDGSSAVSGGGVYSLYSDLTLTGVAFSGNSAPNGSALYVGGSELTITDCTFSGNSGTGAAIAYDTLTATGFRLESSTVAGNTGHGVRLGLGSGSSGVLISSTISGNSGNGVQLGGTGGRTVGLLGNIVAGNGGASLALGGTNSYVSQGYNLVSDGGGGYLTGVGDQLNTDPLLGVLGDYGGMTWTQPLLRGSPAIDGGPVSGVRAVDQRGVGRVGQADSGAFESRGFQMAVAGGDNQVALAGGSFASPLSVTITAGDSGVPVTGGPVTFTAPGAGASATVAGSPATLSGATATSGVVTANAFGGSYGVTASTSGVAVPVVFNLRNNTAPKVAGIVRAGASPTGAASLGFTVTFNESVSGLTAANFAVVQTGVPGATISGVTGSGTVWTVTVATAGGTGRVGIDLVNSTGLVDSDGVGVANMPFVGESYVLAPRVVAITRAGASPTVAASPGFTVTFSESVSGLTAANFGLVTSGLSGASIGGVSGSGASWTVTVNRGTASAGLASRTVGLNLIAATGVTDSDGAGLGNLPFVGESYAIAPEVVGIVRAGASPTGAASLAFTVSFSESLSGGGPANFGLRVTGTAAGTIAGVTGSGASRTVVVTAGAGSGTIGLELVDSTGLVSGGGLGLGNLPFGGELYTVDRTPPETVISGGPPGMTASPVASFTFSGSDAAGIAGYECRLDGAAFGGCTSPLGLSGLGIGRHRLEVQAIDNFGNVDPTPAGYDWVVNNLPVISASPFDLVAGGGGQGVVLATVSDPDQPAASLTVTAVALSGTGVAIGGIAIDGAGRVTAIAQADCAATNATFRLTVTDALGGTAILTLAVTVRQPPLASRADDVGARLVNRPAGGCQPPGPGITPLPSADLSAQKAGSLLIFNLYSSMLSGAGGAGSAGMEDARLALTNTSPRETVLLHLFLVDGVTGGVADHLLRLTPGQTVSLLASEIDPQTTGYALAVAVDEHGCPRPFNHLIGDYHVRLASGHAISAGAMAVAAVDTALFTCAVGAVTAELRFDGRRYNRLPRTLAIDSLPSSQEGNETLLVVNRLGGSLVEGLAGLGSLSGILFDDREQGASLVIAGGRPQLIGQLGRNFPRTVPRYDVLIPAGRTGWMKFAAVADEALSGVVINLGQGRFNHGHNLHLLTTTDTVALTMPVIGP